MDQKCRSIITRQINHRPHHVLHNQSGASHLRNGLREDATVASPVITKSAPARILSDAFIVDTKDIGSGIVTFNPSLQLHESILPPSKQRVGLT